MSDDNLVKRLRRRWPNEDPKTQAEKREAADRIEELEAQNELLEHMIASLPPPHPDNTLRNRLAQRRALMDNPAEVAAIIKRQQWRIGDD